MNLRVFLQQELKSVGFDPDLVERVCLFLSLVIEYSDSVEVEGNSLAPSKSTAQFSSAHFQSMTVQSFW